MVYRLGNEDSISLSTPSSIGRDFNKWLWNENDMRSLVSLHSNPLTVVVVMVIVDCFIVEVLTRSRHYSSEDREKSEGLVCIYLN